MVALVYLKHILPVGGGGASERRTFWTQEVETQTVKNCVL